MIFPRLILEIEQRSSTHCMWNPFLIVRQDLPVATSLPVTVIQLEVCFLGESTEVADKGLAFVLPNQGFGSGIVDIEDGRRLY